MKWLASMLFVLITPSAALVVSIWGRECGSTCELISSEPGNNLFLFTSKEGTAAGGLVQKWPLKVSTKSICLAFI